VCGVIRSSSGQHFSSACALYVSAVPFAFTSRVVKKQQRNGFLCPQRLAFGTNGGQKLPGTRVAAHELIQYASHAIVRPSFSQRLLCWFVCLACYRRVFTASSSRMLALLSTLHPRVNTDSQRGNRSTSWPWLAGGAAPLPKPNHTGSCKKCVLVITVSIGILHVVVVEAQLIGEGDESKPVCAGDDHCSDSRRRAEFSPYVICTIGKKSQQSATIASSLVPQWNQV
jgi:hypothetical protein